VWTECDVTLLIHESPPAFLPLSFLVGREGLSTTSLDSCLTYRMERNSLATRVRYALYSPTKVSSSARRRSRRNSYLRRCSVSSRA